MRFDLVSTRCIGLILGLTLLGLSGCEEREVFIQDDDDEIAAYIRLTEAGRELFRVNELIPATPYTLPFGDTVYQDKVDSVQGQIEVRVDTLPQYIGIPGEYYVAEAEVTDLFFVTTLKSSGGDTIEFLTERQITRYGYFAKIGDDRKPFLGWVLWAYNSLGNFPAPVDLTVRASDGSITLPADLSYYTFDAPRYFDTLITIDRYVLRDDIPEVFGSKSFQLTVEPRNPISYYHLVTAETDAGFEMHGMERVIGQYWTDSIATPANNNRLWNVIFVQTFLEPPNSSFIRGWCIPYRVPQ